MPRNRHAPRGVLRRVGILLFAGAVATTVAACANQGPAPALHVWQLDGVSGALMPVCASSPCTADGSDTAVESHASNESGEAASSEPSYQYRGGRRTKTGVAHL